MSGETLRRPMVCTLLALLLAAGAAQAQAQAQNKQEKQEAPRSKSGKKLLTAMDALRVSSVGGVALSPDGQRVAYTASEEKMETGKEWTSTTHVWVVPTAGGEARQYTRGEKSATNPQWSPDGKHLAFLTNREKENERQVWFLRADGGEAWQVTTHKGGVSGFQFSPDSKKLLLLATDPLSKEEEERRKVKDDTILVDQDHRMTHLWLWDIEKKEAKRLTEGAFTCADARWSPDGKWIAYTGSAKAGGVYQDDLFVMPAAGGTPRNLTAQWDLDAGTPVWMPDGRSIYYSSNIAQAVEVFAVDVRAGTVKQVTARGGITALAEVSSDGQTLVGTLSGPQRPAEVYRANPAYSSFQTITSHNAWLNEFALGGVEVMKWKSKDGTEIEGVLTKPVDYEPGRKYPLLLNPHGGPTAASLASFNGTVQVLAANGYMVLQPNFRGSTGRGEKFAQANKNTWGIGDYEDCISGVEAAVARGLADRDRLGAFGWSYGGYMTFWILTQTDMFKAVSPGAGLTNIYSMYSQNDIQRYLRWFYADQSPWDNFELYWDRSPMKHIKNVRTPTLIVHGERDTRVPIAQAQEFYRALLERKVPVEFVVYPREGHGIRELRHQLDRMRRYVSFFGKYLDNPPVTEPKAAGQ